MKRAATSRSSFGEIPAVHALHLADVAERFGADRKALFAGLVDDEALLADPRERLSQVAARFAPTRTDAFALRIEETEGEASIVLEELASFGTARDVVLIALVVGIDRLGSALTGHDVDGVAELAMPAPDYLPRFAPKIGRRMRFGARANRLVDAVRLARAELLLRDAERSIESIALELGYSDAANFTRAFRRWTGKTPRSRR